MPREHGCAVVMRERLAQERGPGCRCKFRAHHPGVEFTAIFGVRSPLGPQRLCLSPLRDSRGAQPLLGFSAPWPQPRARQAVGWVGPAWVTNDPLQRQIQESNWVRTSQKTSGLDYCLHPLVTSCGVCLLTTPSDSHQCPTLWKSPVECDYKAQGTRGCLLYRC